VGLRKVVEGTIEGEIVGVSTSTGMMEGTIEGEIVGESTSIEGEIVGLSTGMMEETIEGGVVGLTEGLGVLDENAVIVTGYGDDIATISTSNGRNVAVTSASEVVTVSLISIQTVEAGMEVTSGYTHITTIENLRLISIT